MEYDVVNVQALQPMALHVQFADDTAGKVRFEPSRLTGVFEVLKNPIVFVQARVEAGAVTWRGNLDLAPDAIYAEIKSHGEWILR